MSVLVSNGIVSTSNNGNTTPTSGPSVPKTVPETVIDWPKASDGDARTKQSIAAKASKSL